MIAAGGLLKGAIEIRRFHLLTGELINFKGSPQRWIISIGYHRIFIRNLNQGLLIKEERGRAGVFSQGGKG